MIASAIAWRRYAFSKQKRLTLQKSTNRKKGKDISSKQANTTAF